MHSHLLTGIDDGVRSDEQAIVTIERLMELGYRKFVTTPHIMSDTYPNTVAIIREKEQQLRQLLAKKNIAAEVEAAAEYYLDEHTMNLAEGDHQLLTFGDKYLLFETNYLSEPYILKDFIFKVSSRGYRPVLAHPERYQYMTIDKAQDLADRGVLLQLNILSLSGFYAKPVQKLAEKLIERKMINFLGTDCHNEMQAAELAKAIRTTAFKKAIDLPLLNSSL